MTKGLKIENWPLSTVLLLIDASLRENISTNLILLETRLPGKHFHHWLCGSIFIRFHIVVSESEAEKSSQIDAENKF